MITFGVLLGLVAVVLFISGIKKLVREKRKAIIPLIGATLLAIVGAGFIGAGGGSNVQENAVVTEDVKAKEEPAAKEEPKEEVAPDTAEEDVVAPEPEEEPEPEVILEPVTLGSGTFEVGTDIPAGRYTISTQEPQGTIATYDSWGLLDVNEMLGTAPDYYVNNITTELEEGGSIEISGLNQVLFTPKQ